MPLLRHWLWRLVRLFLHLLISLSLKSHLVSMGKARTSSSGNNSTEVTCDLDAAFATNPKFPNTPEPFSSMVGGLPFSRMA